LSSLNASVICCCSSSSRSSITLQLRWYILSPRAPLQTLPQHHTTFDCFARLYRKTHLCRHFHSRINIQSGFSFVSNFTFTPPRVTA
jgi:hypothetical protein